MVLRCWNPVEYIQKLIISFYGVRHIKLFKIQNDLFAGVLHDDYFKNLLNSQKYTCFGVYFKIRSWVNFGKSLWEIFLTEQLWTKMEWKWNTFFLSKFIIKVIFIFSKLFFQLFCQNDTNITKQFFLKKLSICFWKNSRVLNKAD